MNITGSKLYLGAVVAASLAMRATIGDANFDPDYEVKIAWALNGVISGLGFIIGPEALGAAKDMFSRLAGSEPRVGP